MKITLVINSIIRANYEAPSECRAMKITLQTASVRQAKKSHYKFHSTRESLLRNIRLTCPYCTWKHHRHLSVSFYQPFSLHQFSEKKKKSSENKRNESHITVTFCSYTQLGTWNENITQEVTKKVHIREIWNLYQLQNIAISIAVTIFI
jgi:hypothetical protein